MRKLLTVVIAITLLAAGGLPAAAQPSGGHSSGGTSHGSSGGVSHGSSWSHGSPMPSSHGYPSSHGAPSYGPMPVPQVHSAPPSGRMFIGPHNLPPAFGGRTAPGSIIPGPSGTNVVRVLPPPTNRFVLIPNGAAYGFGSPFALGFGGYTCGRLFGFNPFFPSYGFGYGFPGFGYGGFGYGGCGYGGYGYGGYGYGGYGYPYGAYNGYGGYNYPSTYNSTYDATYDTVYATPTAPTPYEAPATAPVETAPDPQSVTPVPASGNNVLEGQIVTLSSSEVVLRTAQGIDRTLRITNGTSVSQILLPGDHIRVEIDPSTGYSPEAKHIVRVDQ